MNIFFWRIMKEHSFFLEAGFTPRDTISSNRRMLKMADGLLGPCLPMALPVRGIAVRRSNNAVYAARRWLFVLTGVGYLPGGQAEAGLSGGGMIAVPYAGTEGVH